MKVPKMQLRKSPKATASFLQSGHDVHAAPSSTDFASSRYRISTHEGDDARLRAEIPLTSSVKQRGGTEAN